MLNPHRTNQVVLHHVTLRKPRVTQTCFGGIKITSGGLHVSADGCKLFSQNSEVLNKKMSFYYG